MVSWGSCWGCCGGRGRWWCVCGAVGGLLGGLEVGGLGVEDVRWAGEATVEFVLDLAARPSSELSLVVTYRREDMADSSLWWRLPSRLPEGTRQLRIELGSLDL